YRLRYTSVDEHGGKLEVQRELLIADAQTRFALPALLKVEQSSIDSGGVARVLATSGLASQPLWLEIYADRKLVERRVLPVGGPALQEIKLGPERRGGIGLVLVGLRDYQALEQSGSVFVPWDDRTVQIELASFRDTLRPGQHETFRVRVHAADKARTPLLAAELLGYMYDRSLDVFAPHQPPNPLELYPRRTQTAHTRWGLGSSSGSMVFTRDPWFTLPEGVALHGDELDFPLAYSFGGPGRRGHGLGGGRYKLALQAAPMPVMSAPASSGARALSRSAAAPELAEAQIAADQDGKAAPPAAEQAAAAKEVRSNFAETAFFLPSLVTDNDGSATLEFTVPDSVTAWNVWVHAITRDFRFGTTRRETRSLKDLMVRPYLPRFLRELDDVALKVVVQNASKQPLSGELTFEAFDPATQQSLATELGVQPAKQPFTVAAESSTNLTVALKAPRRVGDVALRVVGKAGGLSDGELRTLPLLPSRLHLVQSKFATLRGEGSSRKLQLPDLSAHDDSSRQHEQLVVTVEAQLFMTVLKSLPFLIDYPYECSEQTLNRFLSAAIVARTFEKYPAVKRMAADLVKQRDRLLASFDAPDPNRVTQLEESPWLVESRGGPELDEHLLKVLDPPVAEKERDRALSRLQQLQHPDGSFPWFPGGRPSPYMTLYLLIGLSRAAEFDVAVPRELVHRAWGYMAEHFRTDLGPQLAKRELSPEIATLLAYATSGFPDPSWLANAFTKEQLRQVLDYAFSRWKELPPLLKAALSTALIRAQRKPDAKLVWDSVMDSAKTTEDEGTFWKPEDYSWLWYHDTIETHAFAVRTQLELGPEDPKLDGLVVWLLLNKKLNHWKSTRATAEVIYSLVKYLDHKSALGSREVVTVGIGNQPKRELVFEPDRYTGKSQVRIAGADVRPEMATIQVDKRGAGVAFASATWHYATDKLPEEGRGDLFQVRRTYFRREAMGAETKLVPLADNTLLHPGDEVEVQLEISARASAEYIHLRDPRAAGLEPPIGVSGYHFDRGLAYYEEIRDSGHNFFIEWMPAGQYTLRYRLRANLPGHFRVGPATLQSMYAPEFSAFSAGHGIAIE
ncbi:MAG: alpha-2-macroglobulin family protein, partial [Polyangiales bacterium]